MRFPYKMAQTSVKNKRAKRKIDFDRRFQLKNRGHGESAFVFFAANLDRK